VCDASLGFLTTRNQMQTTFRDGSINIRPFRAGDGDPLYDAARESIKELCSWMIWCHPGYSRENSKSFIASSRVEWEHGTSYSFAILDEADGAFLGSVGLSEVIPAHGVANLGFWVRSTRTRKGIASAATRLIVKFAFHELHLARVEFIIATRNLASIHVAKKVGAREEGFLRNRLFLQGSRHDAFAFSLIPSDFFA
jgi:RimJ/RimL family protein N-acetyltransferase